MTPLLLEPPRPQDVRQPPAATIKVGPGPSSGHVRTSLLERVVRFDSAHWLPSLLSGLRALETTGENIPGIGDLSVAHATADHVRRLLTIIPGQYLPPPTLAPFSGGGLALSWYIGERELSFTAYPDHNDFVFMRTNDSDEIVDDGILRLDQTEKLGDIITAFLINPAQ